MGSESSSGGAGACGAWKSGDLEIWEFGDGDLEIQKFGDLGTWKSTNLGSKKISEIKILKIQIRSAQNVGKVWISRNKILLALFGAIPSNFSYGPNKSTKCYKNVYFPWWANGPYSAGVGPCRYPPGVGE